MTVPSRAPALGCGELFAGRYRVERLLGEGGMGAVYEVVDERLDERVALKLMQLSAEQDVQRFQREVRLARRITHPNVARTHDIGEAGGQHFLTMELIDGATLDELMSSGPLSATVAVDLAIPIAEGLAAAHRAKVIHRDLKPANIMVQSAAGTGFGRVVITDFGIARANDGGQRQSGALGTPLYMAPEQILGEDVDAAADIYAFGVMLYEMLTGVFPFDAPTPMAISLARCHQPPIDPRQRADVPAILAELLMQCLAPKPADRIASADVLLARLRKYARAVSAETMHSDALLPRPGAPTVATISNPFANIAPGGRGLAVMPFEIHGESDMAFLGDSLAQELVDVLSRIRGLRVLAFGATRDAGRDPLAVGRVLAADTIVTGSLLVSASRVRLTVRLVEVATGVQIYSGRFDKAFEDVLEMQEIIGQRIADALRVEVGVIAHRGKATPEALELYLRARSIMETQQHRGSAEALALLERAVELSPDFAPAVAARAISMIQAWWVDTLGGSRRDWPAITKQAVDEALAIGDDLAEAHLAAAMYALQLGELSRSAQALSTALSIAPTLAWAQRYLAELQCEAGRPEEGYRRAKLALELDPSLHPTRFTLARFHALAGDVARCLEELDFLADVFGRMNGPVVTQRLRFLIWFDMRAEVETVLIDLRTSSDPIHAMIVQFSRYMRHEVDHTVIDRSLEFGRSIGNARMMSLGYQLAAEAHAVRGDNDRVLDAVEAGADQALVDVAWLERCPLFEPVRSDARFVAAAHRVRDRAEQIWQLRAPRDR